MEIKNWICDTCGEKHIHRNELGSLNITGRVKGSACNSKDLKDVCYNCTEKIFKFLETLAEKEG